MKKAIVLGAGGFIGSHLVKRLKDEGYFVRGIDLKNPEFSKSAADEMWRRDLRDPDVWRGILYSYDFDEMYQLAADMGGAGFVFTGENDAAILHNNALININAVKWGMAACVGKIFYSSSACVYPAYNQENPDDPLCVEDSAYPAAPDSDYGWEKLFSERLWLAWAKNHKMNVRIARYHNIFGPEGTWEGGREKAPAALCRKIAMARAEDEIEIWGDGQQTRSFLYIDECLEATRRLMESDVAEPINIGSEEMVTIDELAGMIADISGISIYLKHIAGPLGVRGRNSDNTMFRARFGYDPGTIIDLQKGLELTYPWIRQQVIHKFN